MTLSVIGAGFGRTGTMSTKMALEQLGLGPCHHMEEVFENPAQVPHWTAVVDGEPIDWNKAFAGYQSAIDWPSAHFWRQLADFYPDAKVILTVREPEKWWSSFSETILKVVKMRDDVDSPHVRSILAMAHKIIDETMNGAMPDRETCIRAYEKRIDDVKKTLAPERLLIFDVREGWAPLCDFLGVAPPKNNFPRSNSKDEFWAHFGPGA